MRTLITRQEMDIQSEKIDLAQIILSLNKESVIEKIKAVLKAEGVIKTNNQLQDFEKKLVDKALDSIEAGNTLTHEQVLENRKKRYPQLFK